MERRNTKKDGQRVEAYLILSMLQKWGCQHGRAHRKGRREGLQFDNRRTTRFSKRYVGGIIISPSSVSAFVSFE